MGAASGPSNPVKFSLGIDGNGALLWQALNLKSET
jgi:hypothetical protein